MKNIENVIMKLAGNPSRVGYRHLGRCVAFVVKKGYPRHRLMKLYAEVAESCGCTQGSVSREVAGAARDCFENGNWSYMQKIADRRLIDPIYPGDMIWYIARYILKR